MEMRERRRIQMVQWAFDTLNIAVTKDVSQIKRAYAVLARKYHPEERPAEWTRLHEAYQAAMEYARRAESVSGGIPDIRIPAPPETAEQKEAWTDGLAFDERWGMDSRKAADVREDSGYEELFREEKFSWAKEKAEKSQKLRQRLEKLAGFWGRKAEREWKRFFKEEFAEDEGVEELAFLLEAVNRDELSEKSLQVILDEIEKRKEDYVSREEYQCIRLAEEITDSCQKSIAVRNAIQRKTEADSRKISVIVCAAICLVNLCFTDFGGEEKEGKIPSLKISAAAKLNAKYDTKEYNTETLSVKKMEVSDEGGEEINFYEVISEESWDVIAFAVPKRETEGETRYMIFDQIQSEEIKQALEDRLNERTGCAKGRLLWDSSIIMVEGVGNGFYQARYDGEFESFIQKEAEMRREVPRTVTTYLDPYPDAVNGICEYYVPGPMLQIEDKIYEDKMFEDEFRLEIVGISAELEKCAKDYQIHIRGVTLPDYIFEGTIEQEESGGAEIWELRDAADERGYVFGEY